MLTALTAILGLALAAWLGSQAGFQMLFGFCIPVLRAFGWRAHLEAPALGIDSRALFHPHNRRPGAFPPVDPPRQA